MITKKIRTSIAALAFLAASNIAPSTGSQTIDQIVTPPSAAAYVNQKDQLFQAIQREDGWMYDNAQDNYFLSDDRSSMKVNWSGYKPNSQIKVTDFITLNVDANKRIDTTPLMIKQTGDSNQVRYVQFLTNIIALSASQFDVSNGKNADVLEAIVNFDRMNADGDEVGIQSLAPVMLYAGLSPYTSFFETKYSQNPNGAKENIMMSYVQLKRGNEAKVREYAQKALDANPKDEKDYFALSFISGKLKDMSLKINILEKGTEMLPNSEQLHLMAASANKEKIRKLFHYKEAYRINPNNEITKGNIEYITNN